MPFYETGIASETGDRGSTEYSEIILEEDDGAGNRQCKKEN